MELVKKESVYRDGIEPVPERMRMLPVHRGYPVPWFVQFIDGVPDFRVVDSRKYAPAMNERLCWLCGDRLGSQLAFVIGPMCAVNRSIGEPPAHRECAEFAIRACPFLNQSQVKRNEQNLPEGTVFSEHGIARQPGVMCLWLTDRYWVRHRGATDIIFGINEPREVHWYREGRLATRAEVEHAIKTGLPTLQQLADREGGIAQQVLREQVAKLRPLLPDENPTPKKPVFASAARQRQDPSDFGDAA